MSIKTLIEAAADLREVNEKIDALQEEKSQLQNRIASLNAELSALQSDRVVKIAKVKTEAGTI